MGEQQHDEQWWPGVLRSLEASLLLAGEDLLVGERLELVAVAHVELVLELDPVVMKKKKKTMKMKKKTLVVEGGRRKNEEEGGGGGGTSGDGGRGGRQRATP